MDMAKMITGMKKIIINAKYMFSPFTMLLQIMFNIS